MDTANRIPARLADDDRPPGGSGIVVDARSMDRRSAGEKLRRDTVLWRYLDAAKLFDFFENSKLFFCRADHFSDKFEGAFTPSLRAQISEAYARGEIDYDYEQFKRRMRESVFITRAPGTRTTAPPCGRCTASRNAPRR